MIVSLAFCLSLGALHGNGAAVTRTTPSWASHRLLLLDAVADRGDATAVAAMSMLSAVVPVTVRLPWFAALALLGPAVTGTTTTLPKPVFKAVTDGQLAYPSGHTGGTIANHTVVGFLVVRASGRHRPRTAAIVGAAVLTLATAMAVALIGEGRHTMVETIGGNLAGVLGVALLLDRIKARREEQEVPTRSPPIRRRPPSTAR